MNEFKTTLIAPTGLRECNPLGIGDITMERIVDDETIFYFKEELKGSLTFVGEDFEHLLKWTESNIQKEDVTLIIERKSGSSYVDYLRFKISPYDINWMKDDCQCIVEFKQYSNKYKRYDAIKNQTFNMFGFGISTRTWYLLGGPSQLTVYNVNNALTLHDLLEVVLRQEFGSNMKIYSKFFGWRDAQSYTVGKSSQFTDLIIGHNHDVYDRPHYNASTTPVSYEEFKLDDFIQSFFYLLNLKCDLESEEVLRIEHVSYYENTSTGFDIDTSTIDKMDFFNKGRWNNYEYKNDNRYVREKLDANVNVDGNPPLVHGKDIVYNDLNSINDKVLENRLVFTTSFKIGSPWIPNKDITHGYFICALDNNSIAEQEIQPPSTSGSTSLVNSVLHWGHCAINYHQHSKSYKNAYHWNYNTLEYEPVTIHEKASIVQREIKIPVCDDTSYINKKIKTPLGIGIIKKQVKKESASYALIDIYYDEISNFSFNGPTAVDDDYTYRYTVSNVFYSTYDTFARSFNSLIANDIPTGGTVYTETKKTKHGGTVQIFSNGHFIYTPINYVDEVVDEFEYYYIVNGLISTGKCKIQLYI